MCCVLGLDHSSSIKACITGGADSLHTSAGVATSCCCIQGHFGQAPQQRASWQIPVPHQNIAFKVTAYTKELTSYINKIASYTNKLVMYSGAVSARRHRSGLPGDFPVRQLHFGSEATSPLAGGTHLASSPRNMAAPTLPTGAAGPLEPPSTLQTWCEPGHDVAKPPPSIPQGQMCEPSPSPYTTRGAFSLANAHAWKGDLSASPHIGVPGSIPREGHFWECEPSSSPPSSGESARSASLIRLLHDLDLEDAGAGFPPSRQSDERHGFSMMSPILSGVTPASQVSTPDSEGAAESVLVRGGKAVSTPALHVSTPHTGGAADAAEVEGGSPVGGGSRGPRAFLGAVHWGSSAEVEGRASVSGGSKGPGPFTGAEDWASSAGGGGALVREGSGVTFFGSPTASLGGPPPVRGSVEWGSPTRPAGTLAREGSGVTVFASPTTSLHEPSAHYHTDGGCADRDAEDSPVLAWTTGRRAATRRVISDGEDDTPSGLGVGRPQARPAGTGLFGEMSAVSMSPHQEGPDGIASSQYVISDSDPPTPTAMSPQGGADGSSCTPQGGRTASWRDATSQGVGTSFWTGATSRGGGPASWRDATSQGGGAASWRDATSQGGESSSQRAATLQGRGMRSGKGTPGSDTSGSLHIGAKSTRRPQFCLASDSEQNSACSRDATPPASIRDVTPQRGGRAAARASPGSRSSGSLRIVAKSTRRPQYCLASDSEHESPCGVSSRSPQARAPGARKEAFRVAANHESSSSTGPGGQKEAFRVAARNDSSSGTARARGVDASGGAANSESSSSRAPRARKDAFRVGRDNESSSSSSSPTGGRQGTDPGRAPVAARDAYEFPADEGGGVVASGDPVVRDLGFGGPGRKPLPQAGAVLEAPGVAHGLHAALFPSLNF